MTTIDTNPALANPTVVTVTIGGVVPLATIAPDPFDENLADVHDELQNSFDFYIVLQCWNLVHTGAGQRV